MTQPLRKGRPRTRKVHRVAASDRYLLKIFSSRYVTPTDQCAVGDPSKLICPPVRRVASTVARARLQAALEPLMKKYGVSLYMGGHVHNYERTCFVRHKQCVDDGVVAVQIGTAGQRTHPRDFSTEQPAWSVRRHAHNGYGVFDVTEDRLEFRFIRSSDGKEQDRFALTRANGVTQYANMWTQDVTDDEMIKKLNRKGFG